MKRIALFWFFIFCIFSQINIGAKENTHFLNYRFRWLNTSAGLSQNTVNCIARDKAGFTWIGTNHGLNRFDGQNIQSFFRNSKDGFALSNDIVRCISILKNKTIIIGTLDGVTFFEADKKSSIIIHIDEKTKNSEDKIITNIFEISANRIFIGTTGGLFLFDAEAKKILKHWGNDFFHLRKNLQYFNVWNFIYSQNKIIGFIENKVYEFKVDKNEFRKEGVAENPLTVFCGVKPIPHSEKLLCYGQNVLAVYNSISKKFEENLYPYLKKYNPEGWPESASFMNKNSLWVGLNKTGLIQFSKTKNGWETNSVLLNNTPDFSGKNRFSSLLQDDFGLLWVGTDYGAFYITPNQSAFAYYSRNDAAGFQLKDNTIRSMQPLSGNRILLGSSSGLSVFNLESGEINSLNIPWENNRGKQNSFTVNSIEKTDENFWLIGSDGLAKLDLNLKKIESIQPKNIGKENNFLRLWGLHAGKDSIWICGLNGDLSLYLPSTNKIKYYKPDTSNQVFFQIKKSGDKILIAALGGIYIFNIYEEKFEFIPLPKNLNSIQTNALLALNKNRWLVATEGEGLFCFDETQKKFIVVAGNNNSILPGKVIYSLCMDAKKNFWAGSNCGLYKINSGDFSTELFTIHDGLQDNEFTYGKSIISLANGMVAAGGINGFNLFDPTKVSQNYSSISPRIDRYLAKDKMHYHPLNETNEISVRYKDKLLHLYLSFPDPIFRDKIEYKAMLKGVDDEWRNLGASGDWILSDFNPGNYTILLKACLAETGVAISETKNISFIVTPAFYQKWWFKIFILLLIVSIILTIFLFLYQRKITENKLLQTKLSLTEAEYQITEANMAALRSQMNPHFIFNALSSIQTLIFKNDKDGSINYLQKFAKLVRYILEKSGEQLVEVEEEIKFLTSYLDMQKLRHTDLEISITNNLPENSSHWRIPAMVIQPFLENAIEHAFLIKKAGAKLSLAFELEENSLRILIRDNGIGIKNSQSKITKKNHKSFGVVAVKKRLESISKKYNAKAEVSLKDLSETDDGLSGTEVVLVLPIIK